MVVVVVNNCAFKSKAKTEQLALGLGLLVVVNFELTKT